MTCLQLFDYVSATTDHSTARQVDLDACLFSRRFDGGINAHNELVGPCITGVMGAVVRTVGSSGCPSGRVMPGYAKFDAKTFVDVSSWNLPTEQMKSLNRAGRATARLARWHTSAASPPGHSFSFEGSDEGTHGRVRR